MKLIVFAGAAAILGGGIWMKNPFGDPNVYPFAPHEVYQLLTAVRASPGLLSAYDREPRMQTVSATGTPGKSLKWTFSGGGYRTSECTVFIEPEGSAKSRLDVSCGENGHAAVSSMVTGYQRNAAIELVDATLTGRAYSQDNAKGATATRWPADRVHHGDIFEATGEAIQMDMEMQRELARQRANR